MREEKYNEKYNKKFVLPVTCNVSLKYDSDIVEKLKPMPNRSAYIKRLIREDISKSKEKCKYCIEEMCQNPISKICGDYCPVLDECFICKWSNL